mmetsp:Transcript_31807/g.73831  ORF Transcript_31807/g.73831 Transcript_31807/m.73831 type:complete len:332 (-) Transcript_31807:135-1130(-)
MQERRNTCGTDQLKLLPLSHVQNLLVGLHECLLDSQLDLLIARSWLHLFLSEVRHDVLVQLPRSVIGHLSAPMPVQDSEVDSELLHGLVRDEAVLQRLLQTRPTLGVDTEPQRVCRDVVTLLLLLQSLSAGVDGQRFPISSKHHDLQGARPVVLFAGLVGDSTSFLQVDGVCRRAANHVLPVYEKALPDLLPFPVDGHYESEALVGVPFLHLALVPWLFFSGCVWWLGVRARRLLGSYVFHCRQLLLLDSWIAAFVKLDKLGGLNGFAHLFRLFHLLDDGVVIILNLAEGLRVAFLLDVVDLRLHVQVQTCFGMILPLSGLLVHVPTTTVG